MRRDEDFNRVVNGGFQFRNIQSSDQLNLSNEQEEKMGDIDDAVLQKMSRDYSEEELASAGIKSKLFRVSGY